MNKYFDGFKKYQVGSFKQLTKVLGDIAKDVSTQLEKESVQIAKEVIEDTVYNRPSSEYYDRTGDLTKTPILMNKWKNLYGQGFSLAYDTTKLSASPKHRVRTDDGWKTMLGQHLGVNGEDVRDNIMTWLNEGFHIIGSDEEYEPAYFKEITEARIRARIQEIINSINNGNIR